MNKVLLCLISIVFAVFCQTESIKITSGMSQAVVTRVGVIYYGVIRITATGGSGNYIYSISGLPPGWTSQSNNITVPNILNAAGSFIIKVRVVDSVGSFYESDVKLNVRGISVLIQPSNIVQNSINNMGNSQFSSTSSLSTLGSTINTLQNFNSVNTNIKSNNEGLNNLSNLKSGFQQNSNNLNQDLTSRIASGNINNLNLNSVGTILPTRNPNTNANQKSELQSGGSQQITNLASLYESYPGLPSGSRPVQLVNGRYPTSLPFPTGNPTIPNPIPSVIMAAQAQYSASRDSDITIQEVKRNAAFNRQLYANKAVANLIAIIQQLTANVNAAKNDIVILEKQLKDADSSNQQCNNRIFDLSNTRTKIQNAIKDRQDRISDTNSKIQNINPAIKDLTNGRQNLIKKRTQIESARSPNSVKLLQLQKQLKNSTFIKQRFQRQLDGFNLQIDGFLADIKKTQQDAASAPDAIQLINQQIPIIQNKIDDLQKLLRNAQRQKAKLLDDKQSYNKLIENSNKKINDTQKSIRDIKEKLPDLQAQIFQANNDADMIQKQINDFRNQISQKQVDYKILTDQINTQESLISGKNDQIKKLSLGISNLPGQITTLQQQLNRIQQIVNRQYYICNDAADSVRAAKQNVEAMSNKYNTQSNWLREANNNLQKARAQKQLADQGIQQIISYSTKVLPFSIANNVTTNLNTSLSQKSQITNMPGSSSDNTQLSRSNPIMVGDLRTYLSQTYGAVADPTKVSSVTTLYPLSLLTTQALSGQSFSGLFSPEGTFNSLFGNDIINKSGQQYLYPFSCSGTNGVTQGYGKVESLQPGQILLRQQNGNMMLLKISSCSNLNAISNNYSITPKSPLYFKGIQTIPGQVNLQQLTCV